MEGCVDSTSRWESLSKSGTAGKENVTRDETWMFEFFHKRTFQIALRVKLSGS